jgi:hypothetical protein
MDGKVRVNDPALLTPNTTNCEVTMISPDDAIALHNEIVDALESPEPISDEDARLYIAFLLTSFKNLSEYTLALSEDRRMLEELHNVDTSTVH